MAQVILAMTKNGGIGFRGQLPWHIKEELQLFKQKTMGKIVVMGRKTVEGIPKLTGREVWCLTKRSEVGLLWYMDHTVRDLDCVARNSRLSDIFVAGGAQVFRTAFEYGDLIQKVHLSVLKDNYECDTFFDRKLLDNFVATESTEYDLFTHYVLTRTDCGERQYLDLTARILQNGTWKSGRNGKVVSSFKNDMMFDLRNGFPLLTTKKMFLRGILEEFLFFLRGDTDSTYLSDRKVRIWEGNTSKEFLLSRGLPYAKGVLGPMYGYQWRFFGSKYWIDPIDGKPITPDGGVDQLANVVHLIRTDSHSRRIILTAYNPAQAEEGVLYPCHSITIQFYVEGEYLDMFCYNRSQDLVCGIPFNIASSSLLLMTVAKLTDKIPRYFHMTMGDTHIYENHIQAAEEQMERIPFQFPSLILPDMKDLSDLKNLQALDFILRDYHSHPAIKVEMVA